KGKAGSQRGHQTSDMSQQPPKLDLHGRLKKHAFEHALITTYNFGSRFFEDYALENFKSLQDNGNISVLLDEGEYQDLMKAAAENAESFPKQANLRYLLQPMPKRKPTNKPSG